MNATLNEPIAGLRQMLRMNSSVISCPCAVRYSPSCYIMEECIRICNSQSQSAHRLNRTEIGMAQLCRFWVPLIFLFVIYFLKHSHQSVIPVSKIKTNLKSHFLAHETSRTDQDVKISYNDNNDDHQLIDTERFEERDVTTSSQKPSRPYGQLVVKNGRACILRCAWKCATSDYTCVRQCNCEDLPINLSP